MTFNVSNLISTIPDNDESHDLLINDEEVVGIRNIKSKDSKYAGGDFVIDDNLICGVIDGNIVICHLIDFKQSDDDGENAS